MRTLEERVYLAMVAISKASYGDIEPTFEEMKAAIEAADEPQGQHMSNLINCGTCGYPLAPEERTTLVEKDGVMVKPARELVGLTDEDLIECERLADIRHRKHMGSIRGQQLSSADQFLWHYARAIEAKLREKNGGNV